MHTTCKYNRQHRYSTAFGYPCSPPTHGKVAADASYRSIVGQTQGGVDGLETREVEVGSRGDVRQLPALSLSHCNTHALRLVLRSYSFLAARRTHVYGQDYTMLHICSHRVVAAVSFTPHFPNLLAAPRLPNLYSVFLCFRGVEYPTWKSNVRHGWICVQASDVQLAMAGAAVILCNSGSDGINSTSLDGTTVLHRYVNAQASFSQQQVLGLKGVRYHVCKELYRVPAMDAVGPMKMAPCFG